MVNHLKTWTEAITKQNSILLISHISPDGDTVGATLSLRLALLSLGKNVRVVCDHSVPEKLLFLPGAEAYEVTEYAGEICADAAVAVDISSPELLGKARRLFESAQTRFVIDHHATNTGYGQINYIRGGESSCCLLAYEAIQALGVPITKDIATCLLLGMSTDTGHFQYSSTSPATLCAAAEMVSLGANISDISRRMYRTQSMKRVQLMRHALSTLHFECGDRVGIIVLDHEAYDKTGCTFGEADGLVNLALEVDGVRMAFMLSEREEGIKVSLRATEPDTVNDIALALGGGGHAQAAGCTLKMSLAEAETTVLSRMREKLYR